MKIYLLRQTASCHFSLDKSSDNPLRRASARVRWCLLQYINSSSLVFSSNLTFRSTVLGLSTFGLPVLGLSFITPLFEFHIHEHTSFETFSLILLCLKIKIRKHASFQIVVQQRLKATAAHAVIFTRQSAFEQLLLCGEAASALTSVGPLPFIFLGRPPALRFRVRLPSSCWPISAYSIVPVSACSSRSYGYWSYVDGDCLLDAPFS